PHPEPRRPRRALGNPRHHQPHPRRHGALPGCPPAGARGFPGVPGVGPSPHSDMARRAPFSRPPVVLVANAFGTWLSQALANLVKARGYRVHFVLTGRELLEQAPSVRPDVVVLDADLPDLDSIEVCRTLRQNRAAWSMPVMMITATPATKQQRLAALEAGAWDYLSVLLDPEEVTLKVDALARLKFDMERVLEESAVDPASGLYTPRGLERRARELASDAMRRPAARGRAAAGGARRVRCRGGPAPQPRRAHEPARARRHGAAPGTRRNRRADSGLPGVDFPRLTSPVIPGLAPGVSGAPSRAGRL